MYCAVTEMFPAVMLPPNFLLCGLLSVPAVGKVPKELSGTIGKIPRCRPPELLLEL